jgi:hypothetical protein
LPFKRPRVPQKRTDLNRLGETFRQPDILNEHVKFKIKVKNEQRTQYFRDYEKSKRSRQFLKEWKQNRPWLVDSKAH